MTGDGGRLDEDSKTPRNTVHSIEGRYCGEILQRYSEIYGMR